jgi:hypothetical protein
MTHEDLIEYFTQLQKGRQRIDQETKDSIIKDALQSVIDDCNNWTGGLGSRLSAETKAKVKAALRLLGGDDEPTS